MADTRDTFFFIPHSHWEGAVFKTREQYLEMGLPNILRALKLLKEYPDYRFTIDQACYVQPFLERHPEEAALFRRFVDEGRLDIVGGTDVMLDDNMPSGESFVRQVLYGKGYFRKALGVDVTVGWLLDTFGHHAQMPQVLKLAGFTSFWFFRGVSAWDGKVPSEFRWQGIDGTQIEAFWLPFGYGHVYGSPKTPDEFAKFMKDQYDILDPFVRGAGRVGISGADVSAPEDHVPPMVAEFNRRPDAPFHLKLAVPADYEKTVARRPKRPVVTGEMNPIFQGIYSSRIELKQRTRDLERLLTTAEKLGVLLRWAEKGTVPFAVEGTVPFSAAMDDAILWRAWEPMLFNQAHDLMSGVMTDPVYEDSIRGYDFAHRIAAEETTARLRELVARVDTKGEGPALVVFNSLGWSRTDVVTGVVGITEPGATSLKAVGPDGREEPVQLIASERHADGTLAYVTVAFVARDVPPLGYAVYHLLPAPAAPETKAAALAGPESLESDLYSLAIDPATGAITRLIVKDGNWNALSGPANVAVMEEDKGDFWEPYKPLDGGSRIAMKDRHGPPLQGKAVFSTDKATVPLAVEGTGPFSATYGPVFSELTVTRPFSDRGRFRTTVRVYAALRRVEIRTAILNNDTAVRYRILFPTSIREGRAVHEIPFGAIERPEGIEFPAQNWADWADGNRGVALLNRGLPGNNVADGTMMLSVLRSTRIVAYGFGGGYEPGATSDTGLQLGKELTFDYALLPHAGEWPKAGVHREGMEFNHPLIAVTAASHSGKLPKRHSFLSVSHPNVMLSTLKRSADGKAAVLRVYEAAGAPARAVRIMLPERVVSAQEVNLMEDPGRPVTVAAHVLKTNLRPFEIKTFRLKCRR